MAGSDSENLSRQKKTEKKRRCVGSAHVWTNPGAVLRSESICLPYTHWPKPSQPPDFNTCPELFNARAQLFISLCYIWIVCKKPPSLQKEERGGQAGPPGLSDTRYAQFFVTANELLMTSCLKWS